MGSQATAFAWDPMGYVSTSAAKRPARRSHLSETLGIMRSRFPSLGFLKAFMTDVDTLGDRGPSGARRTALAALRIFNPSPERTTRERDRLLHALNRNKPYG